MTVVLTDLALTLLALNPNPNDMRKFFRRPKHEPKQELNLAWEESIPDLYKINGSATQRSEDGDNLGLFKLLVSPVGS